MARLAVNVDHVATLRQARKIRYPDPVAAAVIVELAGADGVVVHLREDRRHIQDRDVRMIRDLVQTKMILEMACTDEMIATALTIKPDLVTLVPEKREELTTEGGLDLTQCAARVSQAISELKKNGIPVSLFIDADSRQIELAAELGAEMVEIHTGRFCDSITPAQRKEAFHKIVAGAGQAHHLGLGVNAGHGLCYQTILHFKGISEIDEFSIGHSIISRAIFIGLERAVKEMLELIRSL
ncbi:MAG: pyridoxine 5'-phosphate synthase [Thermodesulfobacteriota bacterium]